MNQGKYGVSLVEHQGIPPKRSIFGRDRTMDDNLAGLMLGRLEPQRQAERSRAIERTSTFADKRVVTTELDALAGLARDDLVIARRSGVFEVEAGRRGNVRGGRFRLGIEPLPRGLANLFQGFFADADAPVTAASATRASATTIRAFDRIDFKMFLPWWCACGLYTTIRREAIPGEAHVKMW